MKIRTVLEGNAFYEIDEECLEKRKKLMEEGIKKKTAANEKAEEKKTIEE